MSDTHPTLSPRPYTSAVYDFISVSPWLVKEDQPAVVTLITLAAELDDKITAALVAQFGLAYRALLKRNPTYKGVQEDDELEDLINEAQNA